MLESKELDLKRHMICQLSMGRVTPDILKKFDEMTDEEIRGHLKTYHAARQENITKQITALNAEHAMLSKIVLK